MSCASAGSTGGTGSTAPATPAAHTVPLTSSESTTPALAAVTTTAVLWGTTGTAATFSTGVGPLATGAAALGIGGLLQALVALPALKDARRDLWTHRALVLVGAVAVVVYPLTFYSSMHLAGVAVGTVVSLASAPLFHVAALNQQVMTSYIRGATTVFLPKWQADAVFDNVERYGVTWLFGVTTMFVDLVDSLRWATADLSTLRFVNSGGAPIPVTLINAFLERGIAFCQGYGLTETAPGATFLTAEDALRKPGSAGRAVPFAEVKVVGADGDRLPPGERGEILVRGPNVIKSYWDNETATREAFHADGWFRTGDIGYMDDEDYLYIVDRIKDMYISGGENVYPAEVEETMLAHPDVTDVAVVGRPRDDGSEDVVACVILRDGAALDPEGMKEFARTRLTRYKVPRTFYHFEELAKDQLGKIRRREVQADLLKLLEKNEK